jgi:hypothetical protein
MKRLFAVAAVLLVLGPCVSAGATSSLKSELLSLKQFPAQWSKYGIATADTRFCPEASFKGRKSASLARVVFANRGTESLFLEQLHRSKSPATVYASEVANATHCKKTGTEFKNTTTFETIKPVHLGKFSVPVRAFSMTAEVNGDKVTGCVVYARKGQVVFVAAEISLDPLNVKLFKSMVAHAIAKVPS